MIAQIRNTTAQRQRQGVEAWLAYEQARRRQALANFKAQHGYECPDWMDMGNLMRNYAGYIWRKTTVPKSGKAQ